jgi:hypothetical protein
MNHDNFFSQGGREPDGRYPAHYSDLNFNEREYAVVAIDHNQSGGQSIAIMRLLTKEEASDIVRGTKEAEDPERERVALAMNFIRACNVETAPRSLLKSSSPGATGSFGGMPSGDAEYEIARNELPVEQERLFNLACVTVSQYLVKELDPKHIQLARGLTDDLLTEDQT